MRFLPWLVVLIYSVPIIGTLASMRRRFHQVWSISDSIRKFFPEDRFYKKIKEWQKRYTTWRTKYPIGAHINLDRLNLFAGKAEYAFGHLRDYTIGIYMMTAFVFNLTMMVFGDVQTQSEYFSRLFYHGVFASLSLWSYRRHVATGLMMTEFMRVNPHVHPNEFFEHYYRRLGPSTIPVPSQATKIVNPLSVSYLTGKKPRQSYWKLIQGFYDTAIFARSAHRALDVIGPQYGREVFDVMASLWGSRMLQLFQARLEVQGIEKFNHLSGKIILVFNHKSHLDFVFNFFALSPARLADGRSLHPRYMAAKDHFVDNKIVYSGVGIGKLIESVDMVFVDRKGKGKDAVLDACQRLVGKDIQIAMYPQGTRAVAYTNARGERMDAGFYTTGTANSLKKNLGHLKKGCAFLAIDTVLANRVCQSENQNVHLVFIGIEGTATLVPKGAFKVQTEGTIRFTVGDHLTLTPADVEGTQKPAEKIEEHEVLTEGQKKYQDLVDRLQHDIHCGLIKSLDLHEKLKTRFVEQVKQSMFVAKENWFTLQKVLNDASQEENFIPFQIIDSIYSLPYGEQEIWLREFSQALVSGSNLKPIRDRVTDELFRYRGKELKSMKRQEKAHQKIRQNESQKAS